MAATLRSQATPHARMAPLRSHAEPLTGKGECRVSSHTNQNTAATKMLDFTALGQHFSSLGHRVETLSVAMTLLSAIGCLVALLRFLFLRFSLNVALVANKPALGRALPGPRGLPFLGSILEFSPSQPEKVFTRLARRFGPVYHVQLGPRISAVADTIVVNSAQAAHDLLETRGAKYSSRARFYTWSDVIMPGARGFLPTPYNHYLKKIRRVAHASLNPKAVERYRGVIDFESRELLKSLLTSSAAAPIDPATYCRRYSMNVALSVIFDARTKSLDDPLFKSLVHITEEMAVLSGPITFLMDYFPFLRWIPNPVLSRCKRLRDTSIRVWGGLIDELRIKLDSPSPTPNSQECMAAEVLRVAEKEEMDALDVIYTCGAVLSGGLETVGSTLTWLFAVLTHYPLVAQKAYEELMHIVGPGRLPEASDEPHLPFVRAVVKEILRFRPPAPLGVPHATSDDDVYMGFSIPTNTNVILNIDAIHNDPLVYSNPNQFDPERFLRTRGTPGALPAKIPGVKEHWAFGAGRRVCIGQHLAEREVFLAVARILWGFRIRGPSNKEIDIDSGIGGLALAPTPYKYPLLCSRNHVMIIHYSIPFITIYIIKYIDDVGLFLLLLLLPPSSLSSLESCTIPSRARIDEV
ncbi:uncharacterized protein VTP21DRAFT_4039 [Calcarisporiella thermophila]|uniref:uncharacterized protein n=1 Tax=Calcarisporiella thermophila TaxID=911321 RepID=UPI0037448431